MFRGTKRISVETSCNPIIRELANSTKTHGKQKYSLNFSIERTTNQTLLRTRTFLSVMIGLFNSDTHYIQEYFLQAMPQDWLFLSVRAFAIISFLTEGYRFPKDFRKMTISEEHLYPKDSSFRKILISKDDQMPSLMPSHA